MKYFTFLLLICCIYYTGSISCQQKRRTGSEYFLPTDTLKAHVGDTVTAGNAYTIEFNYDLEPNRGDWQNPDLIIRKMGLLSDKIVADIGSGTGYFTLPIARLAKRVIAIDIEQRYLDYIEDRKLELPAEEAENIETRLTIANEPNLHAEEVDIVLMVNVFYYLEKRTDYMEIVRDALKNSGMLVLVDFKPGELPVGPEENKVPTSEVKKVLELAGFQQIAIDTTSLKYQYIITAN